MQAIPRTTVSFIALLALLFIVPFFEGGRGIHSFIFALICLLPVVYFMLRESEVVNFRNNIIVSLCIFLAGNILVALFASDFYSSFFALMWWWIYFVVFISVLTFVDEKRQQVLSYSMIGLAIILGLFGVYYFVGDSTGYLRLRSVFLQHNAFGGFMLLPVFISLGYFLNEEKKRAKIALGAISAFLIAVLLLTFSRGSIISFLLAGFISLAFIVRKNSFVFYKKTLGQLLIVLFVGIIVAFGIFSIHTAIRDKGIAEVSEGVYRESSEENAVTLRLHYWQDALNVIKRGSVVGAGLDNYAEANRAVRNKAAFFSADPHNLYLKLITETGIIAFAFFAFIILLLTYIWKWARKGQFDYVTFGITAGLIAVLIHNGMEIDWRYPANVLLFFVFAAVFLKRSGIPRLFKKDEPDGESYKILMAITLVLFFPGTVAFLSEDHLLEGNFFHSKNKTDEALIEYHLAEKYNYLKNAEIPYRLGVLYLKLAKDTQDPAKQRIYLSLTEKYAYDAIHLNKENSNYYALLVKYLDSINDKERLKEALEKTIMFGKGVSYLEASRLAQLYIDEKKTEDARTLLESTIAMFETYGETVSFKNDPNKTFIQFAMLSMYSDLIGIYEKSGEVEEVEKTEERMKRYLSL